MRPCILVVAPHSVMSLGLTQAMLKFGYQITTAYPDETELASLEGPQPSLAIVRLPAEAPERHRCLELIKAYIVDRGIPVVAWVLTRAEARMVQQYLSGCVVMVGNLLHLDELYEHIQKQLNPAGHRALRIATELMVGHRRPEQRPHGLYSYDKLSALSAGGCFIATHNPYPVGSAIELILLLGDSARALEISGKVRYHRAGGAGDDQGMGVAFENLSGLDRSSLESFLLNQLGDIEHSASS